MDNQGSEERLYQVALHFTPGIGHFMFRQLLAYCGSAKAVFSQSKGKLSKIPGIGPKVASLLQPGPGLKRAEEELKKIEGKNIRLITFTDKAYPSRLKHMPDSPPVFFFTGREEVLHAPRILAVVGSRNASEYGKRVTEELLSRCKGRNVLVVSGLAYGIDVAAHRAALQHDVPTLAVIGSGLDHIYPALHKDIARQMCSNGGVMTEYSLGTKPEAYNFPERNRIVAGLSDALIVIESAKKGGALITAELAAGYHKEVYAVPGQLGHKYSEGCNALIHQQKAQLYLDPLQLFDELQWGLDSHENELVERKMALNEENFSPEEWIVITALEKAGGESLLDELSWRSQIAVGQLANLLLQLEFKGLVRSLPGKRFRLEH